MTATMTGPPVPEIMTVLGSFRAQRRLHDFISQFAYFSPVMSPDGLKGDSDVSNVTEGANANDSKKE